MINIITGKINSGKSTTMSKIYDENKLGDGYISVKRMTHDKVHGYDIVRLSDKTSQLLVIREEFYNNIDDIACEIGPYLFLESTLKSIEESIENMIENNVSPIYLDEIGQLELYDQCFDKIFRKIIQSNTDCYVTVREDLVEKVIEKYQIKDYNIIQF